MPMGQTMQTSPALEKALAEISRRSASAQVQRDYGDEAVEIGAGRIIENPQGLAILLHYWPVQDLEEARIEHLRFIVGERLRAMESLRGQWAGCANTFRTLREAARALIEVDHAGSWEKARQARREGVLRSAAE